MVFSYMVDNVLVPGEILSRNVNIGVDPHDSEYQLLKNIDSGQTVRCL